jgi:hypothetical protein
VPRTDAYYRYNPKGERPNPYVPPSWDAAFEDHDGKDAWRQLREAQAVVARILKDADPDHLVLSGVETVGVHFAPDNESFRRIMTEAVPPEVDLLGYHQYANGTGEPVRPWGYHPFLTAEGMAPYDADMHVHRQVASGLYNGRPLVIGECNVHHDPRPDVRAYRLENLRKLLMASAGVVVRDGEIRRAAPVRAPVVLGWYWLQDADLVTGYSLYPASMKHLYERPDLDEFAVRRVAIFRELVGWQGLE